MKKHEADVKKKQALAAREDNSAIAIIDTGSFQSNDEDQQSSEELIVTK